MHARIRTWFPFNIRIALNGREWLRRQMAEKKKRKEGPAFRQRDNCFVRLRDYQRAQALLHAQLRTCWTELLGSVANELNPIRDSIFERYPTEYYWTVYPSEWATDVVFRNPAFPRRLMRLLVRHGVLRFSSADVLRYFGRRLNQSGAIPANFGGTIETDLKQRAEGERVKYRFNGNSAKFYDKAYSELGSVLRAAETTLNTVNDFRVCRPKEGGPEEDLQVADRCAKELPI